MCLLCWNKIWTLLGWKNQVKRTTVLIFSIITIQWSWIQTSCTHFSQLIADIHLSSSNENQGTSQKRNLICYSIKHFGQLISPCGLCPSWLHYSLQVGYNCLMCSKQGNKRIDWICHVCCYCDDVFTKIQIENLIFVMSVVCPGDCLELAKSAESEEHQSKQASKEVFIM